MPGEHKMKARRVLTGLKDWFAGYVGRFSSDDPVVQENMDLKRDHTLRVCEEILDIGGSLDLSDEDLCVAEICALLHDIGRFDQYRRYRTFSDYRSEDHAKLGVKIIRDENILDELEPVTAEMITWAVGHHNRAALPPGQERFLFFLKLLRDADKADIWHVVTDYYENSGDKRNQTIELDLPDTKSISGPIYKALMRGELAQMRDLRTLNDFKALQIGWIYDVNFLRTFQIVRERGYLEKIRDAFTPGSLHAGEIYVRAREYLDSKSSHTD